MKGKVNYIFFKCIIKERKHELYINLLSMKENLLSMKRDTKTILQSKRKMLMKMKNLNKQFHFHLLLHMKLKKHA